MYFSATAITECDLLKGVVYSKNEIAHTHSIFMDSNTGTIRFIETRHNLKTAI